MTEILTPSDLVETVDAIRQMETDGQSLLPCGNRTRISRHNPDAAPALWLSLSKLDSILDIQPDDLTGAAVYFASDDARYVTGQTLVISGGRHMP